MELPRRKPIRLEQYDYSSNGSYFVTICTRERFEVLSVIEGDGECASLTLLPIGTIVEMEILRLKARFGVTVAKYVIMPNHVHMIIKIYRAEQSPAPTISGIICSLKSITTKTVNRRDNMAGQIIWQRSFYDHIIRDKSEYERIWHYIDSNPQNWNEDSYRKH